MLMQSCRSAVYSIRRCTILLFAFAAFGPPHSLAQAAYPAQPAVPHYVLTGTVVNSVTGTPIPYALVQAESNAKLTDQNGNFRFENLISTSLAVMAHKPGFFAEQDLGQAHRPTMITLSDHPTNTVISLIPEAVITGHVEDSDGEPLSNLPIRVRYGQLINGRRMWQQQQGGQGRRQTDEEGNFRIAELKPGTYYVAVGPSPRSRAMQEPSTANQKAEAIPAEYYPGVREMSNATPLQLSAGQHVPLQFSMKEVPAFHLSGMIAGGADFGGNIALLDQDGDNIMVGVRMDRRTGRFDAFPVPAGSYRLHFNGRDSDGQQLFADAPINVSGDISELRLTLQRAVNIPVEFEAEFTKQNTAQSTVSFGSPNGTVRTFTSYGQVRLISRTNSNRSFMMNRDGEGGMTIQGIEPGTYDVEIDANGSSYVASATYNGINLLTDPLVVVPGTDPQAIHIVVRDDGASLNGAVQIPSTGQTTPLVLIVPEGSSTNPPRQLYVDSSGNFHAQEIAPGSYEILAFDRLDGVEYTNRSILNAYLGHAAHVTLSADEQAKVTVDLIQTQQ